MATEVELERLVTRMVGDGSSYQKMTQDAVKQTRAMEGEINGTMGRMASPLMSLMGPLAGVAAGYVGLQAVAGTAFKAISGAAEMEQAQISFGVLLKSTDTAKKVLGDLSQFAAETPFELPELTGAARKLAAFGTSADKIVPELRMLGDVASGISQPIGEIAELYGKARVQGRLFGEDINQMTGRGIPIIQQLAKQFGVADGQVKKLVEQGKVGFPQIETAFQALTAEGGQFGGMMAQQSQSLSGLWSTLKDSVNMMFRDAAGGIMEMFNFKGIMSGAITALTTIQDFLKKTFNAPFVKAFFSAVSAYFHMLMGVAITVWNTILEVGQWAFNKVYDLVAMVFPSIKELGIDLFQTISDYVTAFYVLVEFAFTNWKALGTLAMSSVLYESVKFFNETIHFFTNVLPNLFTWFRENWQNVFFTAADYALTVLINLGQNIRTIFANLMSALKGQMSFGDIMKGVEKDLTKGFVNSISKMPDIPERVIGELEQNLADSIDNQSKQLIQDYGAFIEKRMEELKGAAPPGADVKLGATDTINTPTMGSKIDRNLDFGVTQEQKQALLLQSGKAKDDPNKKVADNTEKIVGEMKTMNETQTKIKEQLILANNQLGQPEEEQELL